MMNFEEKNNEEKEEKLEFGKDRAGGIRVWIGRKKTLGTEKDAQEDYEPKSSAGWQRADCQK